MVHMFPHYAGARGKKEFGIWDALRLIQLTPGSGSGLDAIA